MFYLGFSSSFLKRDPKGGLSYLGEFFQFFHDSFEFLIPEHGTSNKQFLLLWTIGISFSFIFRNQRVSEFVIRFTLVQSFFQFYAQTIFEDFLTEFQLIAPLLWAIINLNKFSFSENYRCEFFCNS